MITGKRVTLREFRESDLEDIQNWVNNFNIRRYLGFSFFPQTREQTREYLERQLKRTDNTEIQFAISLKEDPEQQYIGGVGLHAIDYIHSRAEVGIAIGREELLGQGLGREAMILACGFAFLRLGLHKVYLRCFAYNERGYKSYRKIGFREVGRLREQIYFNGTFHDDIYMDLLQREFLERYPDLGRYF